MSEIAPHKSNNVLITDAASRIDWGGEGFTRLTVYTLEKAGGKNPAISVRA